MPLQSEIIRWYPAWMICASRLIRCVAYRSITIEVLSFCTNWPFTQPSVVGWADRWVIRAWSGERVHSSVVVQVFWVKYSGRDFALKALRKHRIFEGNEYEGVKNERDVLVICREQPFIIQLHAAFHDFERVYFLMEYAPCGAFYEFLMRFGSHFDHQCIRWFSGQIACALDYLHSQLIVSLNRHRPTKIRPWMISRFIEIWNQRMFFWWAMDVWNWLTSGFVSNWRVGMHQHAPSVVHSNTLLLKSIIIFPTAFRWIVGRSAWWSMRCLGWKLRSIIRRSWKSKAMSWVVYFKFPNRLLRIFKIFSQVSWRRIPANAWKHMNFARTISIRHHIHWTISNIHACNVRGNDR